MGTWRTGRGDSGERERERERERECLLFYSMKEMGIDRPSVFLHFLAFIRRAFFSLWYIRFDDGWQHSGVRL